MYVRRLTVSQRNAVISQTREKRKEKREREREREERGERREGRERRERGEGETSSVITLCSITVTVPR